MKSFLSSGSHSLEVLNSPEVLKPCSLESIHEARVCCISKAVQLQAVSHHFYCRLTFHPSCIVQAILGLYSMCLMDLIPTSLPDQTWKY